MVHHKGALAVNGKGIGIVGYHGLNAVVPSGTDEQFQRYSPLSG